MLCKLVKEEVSQYKTSWFICLKQYCDSENVNGKLTEHNFIAVPRMMINGENIRISIFERRVFLNRHSSCSVKLANDLRNNNTRVD